MAVNPVDSSLYQNSANATTSSSSDSIGGMGMSETDFMDLLVAQLKNQDPDSPQDPSQFAAQLAQFATVEQLQSLNQNLQSAQQTAELGEAAAMIGKTVTVSSGTNQTDSGVVQSVTYTTGSNPQLVLADGNSYDFSTVQSVE